MLRLETHKRFDKDAKLARKRGLDLNKLWDVVASLQQERPLPLRCRPHRLTGDWSPFWECHIEPDWLLIYHLSDDALELIRTGTHSDLFG